jgi:hypothetical protein
MHESLIKTRKIGHFTFKQSQKEINDEEILDAAFRL